MIDTFYLALSLFVFVAGTCIGSFLNVCIHRIPREQSIVTPRSRCPYCLKTIAWYDNVPLLSYVLLRARCRHCRADISPRYAVVEFLTGALFLLVFLQYEFQPLTWIYWIVVAGLVAVTFIDLDFMMIPDRFSIGGIVLGVALSGLFPRMHDSGLLVTMDTPRALLASLGGAALGVGLLWVVGIVGRIVFKKDAMGMGDVKLLGAMGAFLGWEAVLFIVFFSSILGTAAGVGLIVAHRRQWSSRVPYGPFLAAAAVIWMLVGRQWWLSYLEWAGGV